MLLSLLNILLLGGMFLYMLNKAQGRTARRLALVPLTMCVMEIILLGILDASLYPALTAVLVLMRATVLACCVLAMRADALAARARSRSRRRAPATVTRLDEARVVRGTFTSRCA